MHLYSRSRNEIWHKGATSGNFLRLQQLRYDCDGDALVALVEPAGPACHTGERSCFYRDLEGSAESAEDAPPAPGEPVPAPYEALAALERTLLERQRERPDGSYTVELLDDPEARLRQGEGGGRARWSRRSAAESEERVAEEGADVDLPPRGAAALARRLDGRGPADPERPAQVARSELIMASPATDDPGSRALEPDLDRARELAATRT